MYQKDIEKNLLENKSRRFLESESVDNQRQIVARLLNAPLKEEEANLALLASLSKASYDLDIAKALDKIQGDDLLVSKVKNMLISNAGGFYNIAKSIATPKLNEITNYLVNAIAFLGKETKNAGKATSINRSEIYRELANKINERIEAKVQVFDNMQIPKERFIHEIKADILGASLVKFSNQDFASQRLYEALKEMPEVLEKKFAEPSFDFFGDSEVKSLSQVDLYDFLDYMIGKGQQNEATSALKDALINLKKYENTTPTPPTPPTPPKDTPPKPDKSPSLAQENNLQESPSLSTRGTKGEGIKTRPRKKTRQAMQTQKTQNLPQKMMNISQNNGKI